MERGHDRFDLGGLFRIDIRQTRMRVHGDAQPLQVAKMITGVNWLQLIIAVFGGYPMYVEVCNVAKKPNHVTQLLRETGSGPGSFTPFVTV